ncbi:3-oxoacyl-(acyl-carrier-protein) reductase [Colletotrichum limetticola]|uniref:3-oxoacyl-(Acyl-carrier-protein) reductase n=1 Tax=Colletotrichum limetticola TaxID=1209924 RepID=A0ABQ9PP54_9PEZI|nr:3-oxoacyl-(acyl-carrier-protein) reductase [Colletotrichum limetticola]
MSSNNKTIAITGTAGVKDPATAVYLASRGASLAISDVQLEALKAVADKLKTSIPGIRVEAAVVDISKPEKVRDWFQDAKKIFGRLDRTAAQY